MLCLINCFGGNDWDGVVFGVWLVDLCGWFVNFVSLYYYWGYGFFVDVGVRGVVFIRFMLLYFY